MDNIDQLSFLNQLLRDDELSLIENMGSQQIPVNFIVGAPRSGSTLISQLLAKTGQFGFISNFVAKFWEAPYLGLLLEKELGISNPANIGFQSDFGMTKSLQAPHEFSYFWRRWFSNRPTHHINRDNLNPEELKTLKDEIEAITNYFGKPVFFKNLSLSLHIDLLQQLIPTSKIIICLRDPFFQAQSLLRGRMKFYNNLTEWYSIRPKQYEMLLEKDPYTQVVGQIYHILEMLESNLKENDISDYLVIPYEEFITTPNKFVSLIYEMNDISGGHDPVDSQFTNTNRFYHDNFNLNRLLEAIYHYFEDDPPFENRTSVTINQIKNL